MHLNTTFLGSNLRFEKELANSRKSIVSITNNHNLDSDMKQNIQKNFKKSVQFFDQDNNDPNKVDFDVQKLKTKTILDRFTIEKINLINDEMNEEKEKDMEIVNNSNSTISINEDLETEEIIKCNRLSINFSTNRTLRQKDITDKELVRMW
jgi:hypothetical protein